MKDIVFYNPTFFFDLVFYQLYFLVFFCVYEKMHCNYYLFIWCTNIYAFFSYFTSGVDNLWIKYTEDNMGRRQKRRDYLRKICVEFLFDFLLKECKNMPKNGAVAYGGISKTLSCNRTVRCRFFFTFSKKKHS